MESGSGNKDKEMDYRAGDVEISARRRELRRNGQPVAVERRAMDLLLYLIEHRGRVVDKDELWREVWNARPVSESVIPRAISKARKALGDKDEDWIATVHGVGYRFVKSLESTARAGGVPDTAPSSRLRWIAIGAVLLGLAGSALWQFLPRMPASPPRVAVLPVQVEGVDQPIEWVRYGVLPLIDQALSDDGVPRVGSATVLATLDRNPQATDFRQQARILHLSTGAQRVLLPRLTLEGGRYQLLLQTVDDGQPLSVSVSGTDPVLMAVGAGTEISQQNAWRRATGGGTRKLVTDDPFVNEAYARGLDARLRSRWSEAADFFETVLSAAPDLHWARYQLSLVTRRLGDYQRTAQLNEVLLAAAKETGDGELEGSVQSTAGTLAWRRGDLAEAARWYRQAAARFAETGSEHSEAGVLGNLAILASIRGDFDQAQNLYDQAAQRFAELGDAYNRAAVLKNLGVMNMDRGRLETARQFLHQSLEIRQDLALPREASLNLNSLAKIETRQGNWRQALVYQERVLEVARAVEDPIMEAEALSDLAKNLTALGQLEDARKHASEALFIGQQLGNAGVEALAAMRLARVLTALGETRRAAALCHEALGHYQDLESGVGQFGARLQLARIAMAEGRLDDAQQWLKQTVQQHTDLDNPTLWLSHLRERAHLAAQRQEWPRSATLWKDAVSRARSLGNEFELVVTLAGACVDALSATPPETPDNALIKDLNSIQISLPESQRCLALTADAHGDRAGAKSRAERWKALAGEHWSPEMEAQYQYLTRQPANLTD